MNLKTLTLPYGHSALEAVIPDKNLLAVIEPIQTETNVAEDTLIRQALENPIGTLRLRNLAHAGQRVTIVSSDLTRPCPSERLLPYILDELTAAGVKDKEITVVMALGLHRAMTEQEMEQVTGTVIFQRVRVINHDPNNVVFLGKTSRGTPVEIFRPVVEADLRVCLGNLEFHYFAGYSGGAKAILPGCASRATIQTNHAMMMQPEAKTGRLEGNPVRADIEEGVAMLGVDFILNVIVDEQHKITGAVAGEVTAAHRIGCELVAQRGIGVIPELADIVLVSAGGWPKDINLYQAQKALDNAVHAVRRGGIIILIAECCEGFGNATFEAWMQQANYPEEILKRIQQEFVLGGHKAAAIAAVLKKAKIFLVSRASTEILSNCGMAIYQDIDSALMPALAELGPSARILVMPQGGAILPQVAQ